MSERVSTDRMPAPPGSPLLQARAARICAYSNADHRAVELVVWWLLEDLVAEETA